MSETRPIMIYNKELLDNIAIRDGARIVSYPTPLNRDALIPYICKCGNEQTKGFRTCDKRGCFCNTCAHIVSKERLKKTIDIRHNGVHPNTKEPAILKTDEEEMRRTRWRDALVAKSSEDGRYIHPIHKNYCATLDGKVINIATQKEVGFHTNASISETPYVRVMVSAKPRKTILVHRFVMECVYGVELPTEYDVDHKDANPSNNTFGNLQIMTRKEHTAKTAGDNPHIGKSAGKHNAKPVQFRKGDIITSYTSLTDACNLLNISTTMIYKSIKSGNPDKCDRSWSYIEPVAEGFGEWKDVPSMPGIQASSKGYIRNLKGRGKGNNTPRLGSLHQASGYMTIKISKKGYKVHRLVAEAFHGSPTSDEDTVDHIDRNRENNYSDNLRWASRAEQNTNRSNIAKIVAYNPKTFQVVGEYDTIQEAVTKYNIRYGIVRKMLDGENVRSNYTVSFWPVHFTKEDKIRRAIQELEDYVGSLSECIYLRKESGSYRLKIKIGDEDIKKTFPSREEALKHRSQRIELYKTMRMNAIHAIV